jgi:hypothetical protein
VTFTPLFKVALADAVLFDEVDVLFVAMDTFDMDTLLALSLWMSMAPPILGPAPAMMVELPDEMLPVPELICAVGVPAVELLFEEAVED